MPDGMNDDDLTQRIWTAVQYATTTLDKGLAFDADTVDTRIKYAEWVALLATGGFATALTTMDKAVLTHHPAVRTIGVAVALTAFGLSVTLSAAIFHFAIGLRAAYRQQRFRIAEQAGIVGNSIPVFATLLRVCPTSREEAIEGQFYLDIMESFNGTPINIPHIFDATQALLPDDQEHLRKRVNATMKKLTRVRELLSIGYRKGKGIDLVVTRLTNWQILSTLTGYVTLALTFVMASSLPAKP